jgi:hypothetical protein
LAISTTIGVVSICHGYPEKINGWVASVRNLERKPDEVVLVLWTGIDRTHLDLDGIKVIDWNEDFAFSDMFNKGITNCNTEWIAWIGIDDRYRKHAFNKIDSIDADVLALGFQYDTGQIWSPSKTNPEEILSMRANMIPCGSPFKKWLWEEIPFDQSIAPSDDWVFWLGTAISGATYETTNDIDVDYEYAGHWAPDEIESRARISDWLFKIQKKSLISKEKKPAESTGEM